MQYDREARQTLDALFQYVETQRRRNQNAVLVASALLRSELVCAMGSTDSDCQRVTTGAGNEFLYFFRMGVALVARLNNNFVLDASQSAQLSLDNYAVVMCVLNNLLGQSDVFLERLGGSVDHNGGEAAVDAGLTNLERVAVIQMQSDRDIRVVDNCSLNHLYQIGVVCVSASALGYLQDNRSLQLAGSLRDTLNDLHVVNIESANCVTAVICLLEHLSSSYKCHYSSSFQKFSVCKQP